MAAASLPPLDRMHVAQLVADAPGADIAPADFQLVANFNRQGFVDLPSLGVMGATTAGTSGERITAHDTALFRAALAAGFV
jgi:hypothetical protein